MPKKIIIDLLELDDLADVLGKTYGTIRTNLADMLKANKEPEFGDDGRYKLFGEKNKKWYAYDSERYEIRFPTKKKDVQPEEHPANEPEQ